MNQIRNIAVIGLGFVGLTLSVTLAKKGFVIYGFDLNPKVRDSLKSGIPHFLERGLSKTLCSQLAAGSFKIVDTLVDCHIDAFIIAVGTPISINTHEPEFSGIMSALANVAKCLTPGGLVILRSTVPIGFSRTSAIPFLENESGLVAGRDFGFSFAPERTIEGNALFELENNTQIVGALEVECERKTIEIFQQLTNTIVRVSSLEAAEMVKIVDNTFRDARFAYANEIAMICETKGIDAVEIINAANTHYPRNNIALPGPGVGGPCLSKDPYILAYAARGSGYEPRYILAARALNESIPKRIALRVMKWLMDNVPSPKTSKIFIAGLAFKGEPETSDLRDSTTVALLKELQASGFVNIVCHDFAVDSDSISKLGVTVEPLALGPVGASAVLFLNNHLGYSSESILDISGKMARPSIFYDAWRLFDSSLLPNSDVTYFGVGL